MSSSSSYKEPSDVLKRLFLPPKDPSLTLSSDYQWLVITQEPPLPSIELLAKAEEKLAGLRFDPSILTPSRLDYATSLVMQHLASGIQQTVNLPDHSEGIRYIRFHPTKAYFVFALKVRNVARLELYKCTLLHSTCDDSNKNANNISDYKNSSIGTWTLRQIPLVMQSNDDGGESKEELLERSPRQMNFIYGCAFQFLEDGSDRLLVKVVPKRWPSLPPTEPVSTGPAIQVVNKDARKAPGRTYQDLLKNEHDEAKLKFFLTTELLCINTISLDVQLVQQSEGGRLIQSLQSSPCGQFLLVQLTTQFSYSVPLKRFGKDIQIWHLPTAKDSGASGSIINVLSLPVDDEIPLSFDACSRHPRSFHFHPCFEHTIIFAKATDGGISLSEPFGDSEVEGCERDALYCQSINDCTLSLECPVKLVGLQWRYADIDFCESGLGVVEEFRWNDRMERKWILDVSGNKRLLWERSWEDRYTAPGEPLRRKSGVRGYSFIVQPTPMSIYLKGAGASPLGDRPFLDLLDFSEEDVKTTRMWRCAAPLEGDLDATREVGGIVPTERKDIFETMICLFEDNDTALISRESKTTPRNYILTKLSDLTSEIQVIDFQHPQPDLLGVTKELVQYRRNDGVELTANLYIPANYDGTARPTLFWAYPREYKNAKAAGQVKGSKHRFVSAHWASPIHWAAKGWVIMDDFSLPVVGEGDAQPNDTFIEQMISGATAAVEYVTTRGLCDPARCAVGGHSYGSFMTAHLLSHTSLFAAGIGRSGAFNRTLTPMSFQSEDRSIWEAPDTYITMSPIMHVKKYSTQERVGKLLLIHGEADENSGTFPMQSERYFAALKAFGIESRLCILPHERHSYRAKESILHMAWEQEEWLRSMDP